MGSVFQDMSQFSNLPYLGMELGKWPKFQKLQMLRESRETVEVARPPHRGCATSIISTVEKCNLLKSRIYNAKVARHLQGLTFSMVSHFLYQFL